jgi:amidase
VTRASASLLALTALVACGDDSTFSGGAGSGGSPGAGGNGGQATGGAPANPAADWLTRPLREQVAAIDAGTFTSEDLAQAYLDRIAEIDGGENGIRAITTIVPGALAEAAELDTSGQIGPLHGAAIVAKDNIDTAGLATTAGSIAMLENVVDEDAPVVSGVRAAGGVMLAKTNMSEWANFRGYYASSGWSSQGGQTKNGFDPGYNPCGSSSGSAAAVAAGLASAALGTETDGSITCPAAVNGLVGFKPTVGLVSRSGVIPLALSQDTVGPITRTVGDAARVLGAIAGPDANDPATEAIPPGLDLDFEAALDGATLRGKRVGVFTYNAGFAVNQLFTAERARLEAAGATVIDITIDQTAHYQDEYTMELFEFKAAINDYFASHPNTPASLADLIAFNEANSEVVMPFFGQEVLIEADATTDLLDPEYLAAKLAAQQATGPDGIDAALAADNLDALIAPTTTVAWKTDHENGDDFGGAASSLPATAGYPHLTVPMGLAGDLPAGMSFIGTAFSDAQILALGHAYESLPR